MPVPSLRSSLAKTSLLLKQKFKGDPLPADPEVLIQRAREATGLETFGNPLFLEGYRTLYAAYLKGNNFSKSGKVLLGLALCHHLESRLHIEAAFSKKPEMAEDPVVKPIFVTGLPRAGSTLLQRLLSADDRLRYIRYAEGVTPAPPPGLTPEHEAQRIENVMEILKPIQLLAPELWAKHSMSPDAPEECWVLLRNAFMHNNFGLVTPIPGYHRWMKEQDMRIGYREHKRQLQLLQAGRPQKRWILKAPSHVKHWKELLDVYPDATFLITHRTPLEVIPSIASLVTTIRSTYIREPEDPAVKMRQSFGTIHNNTENVRGLTEGVPAEKVLHVRYPDLTADPLGTVDTIMNHVGMTFPEEAREALASHSRENPKGRHGTHTYSLAAGGITEEEVRETFADYMATYNL